MRVGSFGARAALCFAAVAVIAGLPFGFAQGLRRSTDADAGGKSPNWILPVDTARAVAKRERKPLLIISLNGNLDGNC